MKKVVLKYLYLVVLVVVGLLTTLIGHIISSKNDSTDPANSGTNSSVSVSVNDGSLDGIWNGKMHNQTTSIEISGNNYFVKYRGGNFGKGIVSYDALTITLTSTHA